MSHRTTQHVSRNINYNLIIVKQVRVFNAATLMQHKFLIHVGIKGLNSTDVMKKKLDAKSIYSIIVLYNSRVIQFPYTIPEFKMTFSVYLDYQNGIFYILASKDRKICATISIRNNKNRIPTKNLTNDMY